VTVERNPGSAHGVRAQVILFQAWGPVYASAAMTATPTTCSACGSPAAGKFCSACGTSLVARACTACGADLSPQARYCHRCGRAAGSEARPGRARLPARERTAWAVAGALCLVLLGAIVFTVVRDAPAPVTPDMANTGAAGPGAGGGPGAAGPGGAPPDISRMTPRERFDRLFNRVMQAAGRSDTGEVARFTPMALGAYAQLDSVDPDARYHAAVLRLQVGDAPGALALADTILARSPGHLFGYIVRGTAAGVLGDSGTARRAGREFLSHYAAELAADRTEYREHEPAIEDFKRQVETAKP
jgi:Double zinc ribbon